MCEQRDQDLGVGAAPAGDRIPAGPCLVTNEDAGGPQHRVVPGHRVVEGLVIGAALGDPVDSRIDETQVLACFLLKDVTAERLFEAVRVIAAGEALLAPTVTRRLISQFTRQRPRPDARPTAALATLTPRETQVLRLVAEGLSNHEISAQLTVAEETVKTHVSRVLTKLDLRDRTQAVVTAYESGLVVPHEREQG